MGKQKSRATETSSGLKSAVHKRQEAKRQAKFTAKREAGKAYEYKPISAKKGSKEYIQERITRAAKAKSSKPEYARLRSIFAKLDNQVAKQKDIAAKAKINKKKRED